MAVHKGKIKDTKAPDLEQYSDMGRDLAIIFGADGKKVKDAKEKKKEKKKALVRGASYNSKNRYNYSNWGW